MREMSIGARLNVTTIWKYCYHNATFTKYATDLGGCMEYLIHLPGRDFGLGLGLVGPG
jgi:hypothetical protein